jgi:hypothetical protein
VTTAELPLVLLAWGKSRVVPVKVTGFSVSEESFDTRLNPIGAKVELSLQVLTDMDFTGASIGRDAFVSYQKSKESLAAMNGGSQPRLGALTGFDGGSGVL